MSQTTTQAAALDRDDRTFTREADPYRREILAHCYRMLGSVHEAEDTTQETYLRAWRAYAAFEGRSSMRTWLHRIATNVCLTALESRARRPLPTGLGAPSADPGDELAPSSDIAWLEPVPDALVDDGDPADQLVAKDSIRLAFVAALQHLPPRQRAVLVLRDVLRWSAAEVADAVGVSTAAVNSALQRARVRLAEVRADEDELDEPDTPEQRRLLAAYVEAFWEKDVDALARLLTDDAVWEMPPFPEWYRGPRDIGALIDGRCPGRPHTMRLLPAAANGQPAFGLYLQGGDGFFEPFSLQVLALRGGLVSHVVAFFDTSHFARFDLPARLSPDGVPAPAG